MCPRLVYPTKSSEFAYANNKPSQRHREQPPILRANYPRTSVITTIVTELVTVTVASVTTTSSAITAYRTIDWIPGAASVVSESTPSILATAFEASAISSPTYGPRVEASVPLRPTQILSKNDLPPQA